MFRNVTKAGLVLALVWGAVRVDAAELSVGNVSLGQGGAGTVIVSGTISAEATFGVTVYVELVPRVGAVGTLTFTAPPPVDIVHLGDPWPGSGTFSPFDTDLTESPLLNGSTDDNGTYVAAPLTFAGELVGFPVVASADAGGIWDVELSTSAGDSAWEGVSTTLTAGTVIVDPGVNLSASSFAMPPNSTVNVSVSGEVQGAATYGVTILVELEPRAGTVGTLTFTPAPPVDIHQLGDPWPGQGSFTPYDTNLTASVLLNGSADDNGSFLANPLTFNGVLSEFPVVSSPDADGVWDVYLSTSAGDSSWEGLLTVLFHGVIEVTPEACVLDTDCDDTNPCTSDECDAGECVYAIVVGSCNDADPCTVNDTCQGTVCVGTAVNCSALNNTCNVGMCNPGSGLCEAVPRNEGGACNDANPCTLNDVCATGVCTGTPRDCTALNDACHVGTCNPGTGACQATPANDGGSCEDGNLCTHNDICLSGQCRGTLLDCSYLTDSCNYGGCNQLTGECQAVPMTGTCNDGNPCTVNDLCSGGVCAGTPKNCGSLTDACNIGTCNPTTGVCQAIPRNEGGSCDDADPCTDIDTCTSGTCAGTFIPGCENCDGASDCDDGNVCTQNDCIGGVCVDTNLTVPCNDGNLCTTNDVCSGGLCAGTAVNCSALNDACNVGVCDGFTGTCVRHAANEGGACSDGLACTVNDVCVNGTCSGTLVGTPSVNLSWSPAAPTVQSGQLVQIALIASSGTCMNQPVSGMDVILNWNQSLLSLQRFIRPVPNIWLSSGFPNDSGLDGLNAPYTGVPANDGNALFQAVGSFQTGVNVPPSGITVVTFEFRALDGTTGTPVTIPATAGLYTHSRVLGAGAYLGVNVTGTLGSATIRVTECASAPDCNDGNICTTDACNTGVCQYTNNTLACNDGLYCTATDTCTGGVCVGAGAPCTAPLLCSESLDACVQCLSAANCNDGNVCTNDVCSATGSCQNPNNTALCNDGLWCTTTDRCSGGVCAGTGNACPTSVCDEPNDRCVQCLTAAHCNDSNVCTDDSCNASNLCVHVNNTLPCTDGLYCTQTDTCANGACVGAGSPCDPQSATPVCSESLDRCVDCETNGQCDDGNICTTDLCLLNICTNNGNLLPCDDGSFCTATDRCNAGVCVGTGNACPGQLCDEGNNVCVDCFTVADCTNDGLACTGDACVNGDCVYPPNDALCDDGLFCNGPEYCHTMLGCQAGISPCDDAALCNETNNSCGCRQPVVVAEGCRYLAVTPRTGQTPVALLVTGADQPVACVSRYVQANGTLGTVPVYRTPGGPAGWNTVHVRALEVLPNTNYVIQTECDTRAGIGLSTPASGRTWRWADTDNSGGLASILDITLIVDGFRGVFNMATLYAVDIWGGGPSACMPQMVIDVMDMSFAVDAFKQFPYPCPVTPCP